MLTGIAAVFLVVFVIIIGLMWGGWKDQGFSKWLWNCTIMATSLSVLLLLFNMCGGADIRTGYRGG